MRFFYLLLLLSLTACQSEATSPRTVLDFNADWSFHLGQPAANAVWEPVHLPHDWSIRRGYQQENTAASTGFVEGGTGYYKKSFTLPLESGNKRTWVEFDGIYANAEVAINGHVLGQRPNGYSSFSYDLSDHLRYGEDTNELTVRVDHEAYADTRWYTGSGIYRDVRLVTTSPVHVPQWGVRVTTPEVSAEAATVVVSTQVVGGGAGARVRTIIRNADGQVVGDQTSPAAESATETFQLAAPRRWSPDSPNLYVAETTVLVDDEPVDQTSTVFGIRSIRFDADRGFILNGERLKIKGVNLHHDVGALGAAATKASWVYRVQKLKDIGVNAIRMAHNPHAPILMEVCNELGMLVMDEFFDEWHRPKGKNLVYIGDEAAEGAIASGYSEHFLEWAERDLKDLIRRDFNHPSVIMWSIGNEIEWTFPKYSQAYYKVNPGIAGYGETPIFDPAVVAPIAKEVLGDNDSLAIVARMLSNWVKEEDTTRPTVCGSVRPSIALVSGYADAVDILGFNYRQNSYDAAHAAYPELKLIGSENWGDYSEWREVKDRDFVAGMFTWTGFAYLGEAGPWPRKGLEISFFDYAGFKTPRGHFYECLWNDTPKAYLVTTPAATSEFSYDPRAGWTFTMQKSPPPVWGELRRWEWYKVNEHWNYEDKESIVVQAYTNAESAELFLNDRSLGKLRRADFADDNVLKWLVPYEAGELLVRAYNGEETVAEYELNTTGAPAKLVLSADKEAVGDRYDLAHVAVQLYDEDGNKVVDAPQEVTFSVDGPGELVAVDNGWENNVANHYQDKVTTHLGRALAIVRAGAGKGPITITATAAGLTSEPIVLQQR